MRRREENETSGGAPDQPDWLVWLVGILTEQDYDVKSPRGGGRARLAQETGIAPSTISRIMSGQAPDYESQVRLSRHLGLSLGEFLIRTGKAKRSDFRSDETLEEDFPFNPNETGQIGVASGKRLTPEEIAALAGVPEGDKDWFTTMVRSMRKRGPSDGGSATGGAAAEG